MGKLYDNLQRQLKTEYKQDAENCIKIYNHLKETTGHIWKSNWNPLVNTEFIGKYPNCQRKYKPTNIGQIFLNGLNDKI